MSGLAGRPRGRIATAAAVVAAMVGVAGCGELPAITKGPYWLVKVKGDYANVYRYPTGNKPGTTQAVELGSTHTGAQVRAAAERLGVPPSHVTYEG